MRPPPPGLQQERTSLAWRRTTLSFVAIGFVILRTAMIEGRPVTIVACGFVVVVGTWVALSGSRGGRWSSGHRSEPEFRLLRDGRLPALVTAVAVGLCLLVLVL